MANTLPGDLETLAGAWREFQTWTPVKLGMVRDDRDYNAMVDFLNALIDEMDDCETHPLRGLLDIVGCFVREYEESNIEIPDSIHMRRVEINPPEGTFAGLDRESADFATEFRAAAAAKWYGVGRVSQEVAARIAGVSRSEFLAVLSRLQVSPMQESSEEAVVAAQLLSQS
jgi:hypothetical protein